MKFFKSNPKVYKPLSEYPESWSILSESTQGLIVRINTGYKEAIGNPEYPVKMGVAIPIQGEHDESIAMFKYSMEDTLDEILNKGEKGSIVVVITSLRDPKFIEFLSYTKNNLDFAAIHEMLKNKFSDVEVQMYAETDPKWNQYQSFFK